MPRVTIEVLAERLGLSTASVSYALNGLPGVSATTRTRVLELADELGWRPNVGARALSRARADAVGLLLPRGAEDVGAEPYYMALLAGIESGLAEAGTALMLRFVPDGADLAVYREWHAERRVDGVFLTDLRIGDPRPALLDRLGLPYLVHSGHRIADGWRFGQELETSLLIDHLAGLGHRTLLHVAGPGTLVHEQERMQEVRRTCTAAGIALTTLEADYTHEGAAEVVRAAVQRGPAVSAVLCGNDPMAVGCVRALREAGLEQRIAVVSWDDSVLCETSFPSITALQRQPYETGRESARLLLSGLNGSWQEPEPSSARLVVRQTSLPA